MLGAFAEQSATLRIRIKYTVHDKAMTFCNIHNGLILYLRIGPCPLFLQFSPHH